MRARTGGWRPARLDGLAGAPEGWPRTRSAAGSARVEGSLAPNGLLPRRSGRKCQTGPPDDDGR